MKRIIIVLVGVLCILSVVRTTAQIHVQALSPKEIEQVKRNYKAEGEQNVKIYLFSNLIEVEKGETIKVGVMFEIKPGMNIYGPGNSSSNLPTVIRWNLPKGMVLGKIAWQKAGNLADGKNGYMGYCCVIAELTIGTGIKEHELEIGVETTFQVCDELYCIPGDIEGSLVLSVGKNVKSPVEKIFRNR